MAEQDGSDASPPESQASFYYKSEDGRLSTATHLSSSSSGRTYTPSPTPNSGQTILYDSPTNNASTKTDSLLFNKIDERQRLARERREEREKQNAIKEAQWQAREERARQHYEKLLEERKRKLEEQRIKEEKRRAAVEEKRRQKQEDDRIRHEAVIRRTLERSQRSRQKPNRWSWGGTLQPNTTITPADGDRRSVSTMNLSKHADPVITKRLSSSSATLLHSPDRGLQMRTASTPVINKAQSKPRLHPGKTTPRRDSGLRRLPLTPWESNVVNRLQQPTHSYLARSRSAMSLSGEQAVSCHPMGSMSFKALQAQPLPHCRSQDRSLSRETASSSNTTPRRRTTGTVQPQKKDNVRKSWSNLSLPLTPIMVVPPTKRSSSPVKKKVTAPSPGRPPQRTPVRPPTPKLLKSPGGDDSGTLHPVTFTVGKPCSPSPTRDQEETEEQDEVLCPSQPRPQPLGQNRASNEQKTPSSTVSNESFSSPPAHRPSAGTTDPEEASRILSENRRLAREQREREEKERQLLEEQQRLAKEEMARRKAEERAKREEAAQRLAEERRQREEEERKVEEERLQRDREEAEKLQKEKEEEKSRQREEAERLRQEREKILQQDEAERLARKKLVEDIMKRTRRSNTAEKKDSPSSNGDSSASPAPSAVTVSSTHSSNGNIQQPESSPAVLVHPEQTYGENGEFEEVIVLPSHSRLSPPEGEEEQHRQQENEERAPVIAFKENGLLKPLSGLEDISALQDVA